MNQYIVTIEHWIDGKAESWEQCTLELSEDITAKGLYETLKQNFGKEEYTCLNFED